MEESKEQQRQPPSPGRSPIQLKDCMEELLRFTLASSVDGTLGLDLGLSKEYCSNLLEDDPGTPYPDSSASDFWEGVATYPLYKCLASALYQSISFGAFNISHGKMALIHEDGLLKQKEYEWTELVKEEGSKLLNVLKNVDFELHVQEPYFSQLKDGLKIVEGRCAVGDYNRIVSESLILFNKCLVLQVQDVHQYGSFSEMLEAEGIPNVLPGIKTIEEGVQIYRKFYSEEKEKLNGVLGICVTKLTAQPYIYLASMLSGLSYGGIQRLLGFVRTVGTNLDALPPLRSTILSSVLLPHNPNNKHIVPPHGVVYEIRNAEGYGARWCEDGTKFIGFLEPYTEDGHSKGWKH